MPRDRFVVRLEEPAATVLERLGEALAARVVSVLEVLVTDPWVSMGGIGSVESAPFQVLRDRGYDVRRLKATDIKGWRIFYFIDDPKRRVLVKEIVRREEDTYTSAPHVQRLQDNFSRYFRDKKRTRR